MAFVTMLFVMSISNTVHVISQGVSHPIRESTMVSRKIFNFVMEGQKQDILKLLLKIFNLHKSMWYIYLLFVWKVIHTCMCIFDQV